MSEQKKSVFAAFLALVILVALSVATCNYDGGREAHAQTTVTKARLPIEGVPWGYGTVSVPTSTGGTNTRHKFSPINVLARGVISGDGLSDYDSLLAVIDEVGAAGGGGVYIPAGHYDMIAASPTVDSPYRILVDNDNVHIFGDGDGTVIHMSGVTKAYLDGINDYSSSGRDVFTAFSLTSVNGCSVENLRIVGDWDGTGTFTYTSPRCKGVGVIGGNGNVVRNVSGSCIMGNLVNATPAMVTYDGVAENCFNVGVYNCRADSCLEGGINFMGNTYNCSAIGNRAYACGNGIESGSYGGLIQANACSLNTTCGISVSGRGQTVVGNMVKNNGQNSGTGMGIIVSSSASFLTSGITITGNVIDSNDGLGLQIYPTATNVVVSNNVFRANSQSGTYTYDISVVGTAGNTITDVEFSGNLQFGTPATCLYGFSINYATDVRVIDGVVELAAAGTYAASIGPNATDVVVRGMRLSDPITINASATRCYAYDNEGSTGVRALGGSGSPNSAVSGYIGSVWMRSDGGVGSEAYYKSSGAGTDTGWLRRNQLRGVYADTLYEYTSAAGVLGDGVLLKDSIARAQSMRADSLMEKTAATGVAIDGLLLKDSILRTTSARLDTLAMKTALHGIVIDPILPINSTARAADDSLGIAENVIYFSGQTGNVFSTLPTYATVPVGKEYLIINCDATATDSVFVEANGAEFLNGLATRRAIGLRGYDAATGYFRAKIKYVSTTVGWARVD
jgi:hypothetical protein